MREKKAARKVKGKTFKSGASNVFETEHEWNDDIYRAKTANGKKLRLYKKRT